ncbi:MAG: nucleotidyltransferase family protein [Clostridia bacterium]|nr:nucleotidyltransferase family protein [Clostridia bacterium]
MKAVGIIAEYNPLHSGHLYQIAKAKELTGADYTVICMSGNFVQRGGPAIMDKWTRARVVLDSSPDERSNADLVIELPTIYACNRAEIFAMGAVRILAGIGVTHISFGCETHNFDGLFRIAETMVHEKARVDELISAYMKDGISRAKANQKAVADIMGSDAAILLEGPNNILSIEYLKNIIQLRNEGVNIEAVPVQRYVSGINESNALLGFAGSTEIRRLIRNKTFDEAAKYMPGKVCLALSEGGAPKERVDKAYEITFELLRNDITRLFPKELTYLYCIGEGLENKIKKEIVFAKSVDDLVERLTSKRYTASSIRRILMYILIGLTGKTADRLTGITRDGKVSEPALFARVLAAGKGGREFLKKVKKEELATIPVITNINRFFEENSNIELELLAELDVLAGDMYNLIFGRDMYEYSDKVVTPYIEV